MGVCAEKLESTVESKVESRPWVYTHTHYYAHTETLGWEHSVLGGPLMANDPEQQLIASGCLNYVSPALLCPIKMKWAFYSGVPVLGLTRIKAMDESQEAGGTERAL